MPILMLDRREDLPEESRKSLITGVELGSEEMQQMIRRIVGDISTIVGITQSPQENLTRIYYKAKNGMSARASFQDGVLQYHSGVWIEQDSSTPAEVRELYVQVGAANDPIISDVA